MHGSWSAALAVLLLSSCAAGAGSDSFSAPALTEQVQGQGKSGLSLEQSQRVDDIIRREMAERRIAGASLAIARDGVILHARGYGLADIESGTRATEETRYSIASITKMFTAIAAMMLVQDGRLSLETEVAAVLPNLPVQWRGVTVRQLLVHSSGVPAFTSFETPPCGRAKEEAQYDSSDVLHEVSCLPLDFEPGSNWRYSDTGYHLLGLVIERLSGGSYEEFLRRRIFIPLGMDSTRLIARPGEPDDRATGYFWRDGEFRRGPPLYPLIEMSAGGLASNVIDLARFDAALADGSLVPREVLEVMWEPAGIGSAMYGMGFAVRPVAGRRQVGHTGGGPGAATSFARFTDDHLTVILLTNTAQPPSSIQEIVGEVADAALAPAN